MAEDSMISGLPYDAPQSDSKRKKLLECVLTGNSKLYLGKVYTEDHIKKLSDEEVDKLFSNYEAKLSGQMVKSLGKSIINMYSMGACAALGISNQDVLSEDLKNDPFLNSALQVEYNHKKRKEQKSEVNQYYGIEAVLAVGVIGSLDYYLYLAKKAQQPSHAQPPHQPPRANKFEMN